jgi:hypothetical protein
MTGSEDWVNRGTMTRPGASPGSASGKTFIVSGAGRGGTTMVAAVLRAAGIPMAEHYYEAAVEDIVIAHALNNRDRQELRALIAERNAKYPTWGFKIPNLHGLMRAEEVALFRDPALILIFRDPVAIAVRRTMSDFVPPFPMIRDGLAMMGGVLDIFEQTTCPALMLSYEKAILQPEAFIESLTNFCGLTPTPEVRRHMLREVVPNSETYARGTTVEIAGYVDAMHGDILSGWCAHVDRNHTMQLDLFIGDTKVASFLADTYRADLQAAGYGEGRHGFAIDLRAFRLNPGDRLHVRLTDRPLLHLRNSGKTVAEFRAMGLARAQSS